MGNVRFNVTGQIRDLERANDKLNKDFAKLTEQLAKMKAEGAKGQRQQIEGNKSVLDGLKRQGTALRTMVGQYATIQGAVQLVTAAYSSWRAEIEKTAASHQSFADSLIRTLTETGDLAQGGRIERQLQGIQGATDEQARAAFEGVSGGAPLASLERRMSLTREVARQAPTGVDLQELGNLVGELERISPGLAPDDVADIATKLRATAGNKIREVGGKQFVASVENLMSAGLQRDEALGFATAGLQGGVSSEFFTSLAGKLQGSRDPALEGKSMMEQIQALQADASLAQRTLGVEQATKLNLIDMDAARTIAAEITQAQRQDFAEQQVRQLSRTSAGSSQLGRQRSAEFEEDVTRAVSMEEAQRQDVARQIRARATAQGPLRGAQAAVVERISQFTGEYTGFGGDTTGERLLRSAVKEGFITQAEADRIRREEEMRTEMIRQLRRNADAAERSLDEQRNANRVNTAANAQRLVGAE